MLFNLQVPVDIYQVKQRIQIYLKLVAVDQDLQTHSQVKT